MSLPESFWADDDHEVVSPPYIDIEIKTSPDINRRILAAFAQKEKAIRQKIIAVKARKAKNAAAKKKRK